MRYRTAEISRSKVVLGEDFKNGLELIKKIIHVFPKKSKI